VGRQAIDVDVDLNLYHLIMMIPQWIMLSLAELGLGCLGVVEASGQGTLGNITRIRLAMSNDSHFRISMRVDTIITY